jgi:acyl dehydratase
MRAEGHQSGMYFDDFVVGQRVAAGTRRVTQHDLEQFVALSGDAHPVHWDEEYCREHTPFGRPILHGPYGIAITFGLLHDLGIFGESVIAMTSVHWDFLRPLFVDDDVTLDMTITRCRPSRRGDTGTVHRWLRLVNQHGDVVQEGMSPALLRRRAEDAARAPVLALDFGSVGWAGLLAARLDADDDFRSATATFDGAIGFRAGDETAHLRVFHGTVLECSTRADAARRFEIGGTELEWVDLAFAPRNDFVARTIGGHFRVDGDTYEYLRLTRALDRCWMHVRALAREAMESHAG